MGLYDREYYREESGGLSLRVPQTVVTSLILINVGLWLANGLLTPPQGAFDLGALSDALAAKPGSLLQPWLWWQFLSYGFVHAPQLSHVLFNMLGLFFFGRVIEQVYGAKEFLRIYLVAVLLGSLVWAVTSLVTGMGGVLCGASGAVTAIIVLFAFNFPRATVYLMFVLPVPAWVLGVFLVASDLYGSLADSSSHVAYIVHLTGAAFAAAYAHFHWNLGQWTPRWPRLRRPGSRPPLRIHDPQREHQQMSDEVDRILAKISREGEESLTRKERRTLEEASRQYQKRRSGPGV